VDFSSIQGEVNTGEKENQPMIESGIRIESLMRLSVQISELGRVFTEASTIFMENPYMRGRAYILFLVRMGANLADTFS
jgi:hypothetical protein